MSVGLIIRRKTNLKTKIIINTDFLLDRLVYEMLKTTEKPRKFDTANVHKVTGKKNIIFCTQTAVRRK